MNLRRIVPAVFLAFLFSTLLPADDKKDDSGQACTIRFTVLKDDNGKPVRNAAVILHPVREDGRQAKGGYELKTNSEGQTGSEAVPYGMLRVQVIAPGFQTFGDDYALNQPQQSVTIRLKRPQEQYSIYPDKPKQ